MQKIKSLKQIKMKKIIRNKFKQLSLDDKLIIFTHPKQFSSMYLEKINPNHIGLVWGRRNKKHRKIKGSNWVKVCKIQFAEGIVFTFNSLWDKIIYWLNYGSIYMEKTGFASFFFAIFSALLFYSLVFKVSGGMK